MTGMTFIRQYRIWIAVLAALPPIAHAQAADIKGAADHPLVPRYQDAEIVAYTSDDYARVLFAQAPVKQTGGLDKNPGAALALEGRYSALTYRSPEGRSALEVFRNYQQALGEKGFATVFTCAQAECGGRSFNHAVSPRHFYSAFGEYHTDQQYSLSRLQRPEGDVFVAVYVTMNKGGGGPNKGRSMVQLNIVELKPMEQRMVVLDAGQMATELSAGGRVAIYGILFDHDKDSMRADSKEQLKEIAAMLAQDAGRRVLVVGHTDAQGSIPYNQDLSLRRARAVAAALTANHGIEAARMIPVGVGMAAPVATNRSDEGRAKNRRVELVDLGAGAKQ
jgi:OOP family OmpA-OmpF porin